MLRIGLNAVDFVPGKMGGVETYFRNLVHHLQKSDSDDRYTIFCNESVATEFPVGPPRFEIVTFHNYEKPGLKWFLRGTLRNTVGFDMLKRAYERYHVDVLHHPFTAVSPAGLKFPAVLTFWDMQHEFFPQFFSAVELKLRNAILRSSVREAARIIVGARFTKECLEEKYRVAAEKIEVVYPGHGPEFRPDLDPERMDQVRRKYGLDRPFLYYPAGTWPHKNHIRLLQALRLLSKERPFEGELVLTGVATSAKPALLKEIERLDLAGNVRVLEYLRRDEVPYMYGLARLMVFPSLYEGFGIPLVEAMAGGCPVVCSNAPPMPEIVGAAGVTFDPLSPEEMAETIRAVWENDEKIRTMKTLGLARAKLFSWEETARKTSDVYHRAAGVVKCRDAGTS